MIEWNIGPHLKFRRGKLQSRVTSSPMKIIWTFSFLFRSILSKSTGHGFFCIDLDFGYINNIIFHNRRFGTCICIWIPPFLHWRWENIFLASCPEWNLNILTRIWAKFFKQAEILREMKYVPVCFVFVIETRYTSHSK